MNIFLSGPMAGLPDFNHPAFDRYAAALRTMGHAVWSPAELFGGETGLPRARYVRACILALAGYDEYGAASFDAIALMPGWEASPGSKLEWAIAHELGMRIFRLHVSHGAVLLEASSVDECGRLDYTLEKVIERKQ